MDNLRKGFPILEQYTYLNTAASGLLPEQVWEFRQDHDLDFLVLGGILKEKQAGLFIEVRKKLGSFFACAPNRVALVPNFSYGFNTLLEGLEKPKKVLLLKDDYPAINQAVATRNFELVYAEIDEKLEENIIQMLEKEKPALFAFSIVQYLNGVKLDIDFLKKLKQDFPETILVADGTQYCGTEIFDFDDSGLDVVISSGYKWMNAGYGNGFMLFNEDIEGKIAPKELKFNSLQSKYKPREANLIGKFEPGHRDSLNYGSLGAALDLLEDTGKNRIESQIKNLAKLAKEQFSEMGFLEEYITRRRRHSSIFNLKGGDDLFRFLRSKNIIASQRGDGIRVSFHYFNTSKELDFLIKNLRKYQKNSRIE